MFKIKRIMAFAMAMIICVSLCLINSGALLLNDYTGESRRFNAPYTEAVARVYITEWPQDTGETDLHAVTIANGSDYISADYISCTTYVYLGVTLEDDSYYSDEDTVTIYDTSRFGAVVGGSDLLLGEPYYAIIGIDSYHYVEIAEKVYYNSGNSWYEGTRFDGEPISLGM